MIGIHQAIFYYRPKPKDDEPIREQLQSMAHLHSRRGFWMMFHRLRMLQFNDFNREVLTIAIDTSLTSQRVIRELNKLIEWRGKPERLRVDNGPEFVAQALADWSEHHRISISFIEKGQASTERVYRAV